MTEDHPDDEARATEGMETTPDARLPLWQRGRVVGYRGRVYPVLLVVFTCLVVAGSAVRLSQGKVTAWLHFVLALAVILSMALRHFLQIPLVRAWSAIMILAGGLGLLSSLLDPTGITAKQLIGSGADFCFGVYFSNEISGQVVFERDSDDPESRRDGSG